MLDEVQTGMGRLGKLFGYQRFNNIEPDVMTLGKALGAGTPLGAFASKEYCSVLEPGDHGSTFGGNALTTAAGKAAANYMVKNNIPSLALENGAYLTKKLEALKTKYNFIIEIRGMGLLIGMEMNKDVSSEIVKICLSKGLLLNAVRPNMLRFMPPLNVSQKEIDVAIKILDESLSKTVN